MSLLIALVGSIRGNFFGRLRYLFVSDYILIACLDSPHEAVYSTRCKGLGVTGMQNKNTNKKHQKA